MTVKEAEEQTGLTRSNIRFYEKEQLITPSRNASNGYRDYSESDIENIKKIAYLRTLGFSIEDIRNIISQKISLRDAVQKQHEALDDQLTELHHAKAMCSRMLGTKDISYETLHIETFINEAYAHEACIHEAYIHKAYIHALPNYWKDNQAVFKLDSVGFLRIWGSFITWAVITALCLLCSILSYAKLPANIPVQWHDGAASAYAGRAFIFAYPAACIALRYLLRPFIYAKLQMDSYYKELAAEYLTNYLCLIALSVQSFTILYVYGLAKNVTTVLFADTAVLLGILAAVFIKIRLKRRPLC